MAFPEARALLLDHDRLQLMAARVDDQTAHGGVITLACFTVMIGDSGSRVVGERGTDGRGTQERGGLGNRARAGCVRAGDSRGKASTKDAQFP